MNTFAFSTRILLLLLYICFASCKDNTPIPKAKSLNHDNEEYLLQDSLIIETSDGAQLALLVVRSKKHTQPLPTILQHTIYARDSDYRRALLAASHGYVGVVSYTRGKAWSTSEVVPYEHEVEDVNRVIDWISKQPWSNGDVGMQGGSYNGFTQWAATKNLHPSLKTIVPSASASPGIGEPSENGVYMSFLYPWFPYVSNHKMLDEENYNDHQRWNNLKQNYYQRGVAYRSLDSLDGQPNPYFNKQLSHPTYDEYWQKMMPYKNDFSKINIPILSTSGYYDGGQIGVLHYLREHSIYNNNPNHYLVIGPYGHLGSQYVPDTIIGNYKIDSIARISITALSFEWYDYILKNGPKPPFLKDKINIQVMGSNRWKHVAKLEDISNDTLKFYLDNTLSNVLFDSKYGSGNNGNKYHFAMADNPPTMDGYIRQEVDFTDRSMTGENNYWNPDIVSDSLPLSNGFSFITEPFKEDVEFNGSYFGELKLSINKRDVDCSMVMYENTPDGRYFKLTQQFIGRASLSKDREKRQLLTPHEVESFPFTNVRMTSKLLKKGSRLILVLNVNKHPHEQVNYGTGRDVSNETIKDATEPLQVKWHNSSYIHIPIFN